MLFEIIMYTLLYTITDLRKCSEAMAFAMSKPLYIVVQLVCTPVRERGNITLIMLYTVLNKPALSPCETKGIHAHGIVDIFISRQYHYDLSINKDHTPY